MAQECNGSRLGWHAEISLYLRGERTRCHVIVVITQWQLHSVLSKGKKSELKPVDTQSLSQELRLFTHNFKKCVCICVEHAMQPLVMLPICTNVLFFLLQILALLRSLPQAVSPFQSTPPASRCTNCDTSCSAHSPPVLFTSTPTRIRSRASGLPFTG